VPRHGQGRLTGGSPGVAKMPGPPGKCTSGKRLLTSVTRGKGGLERLFQPRACFPKVAIQTTRKAAQAMQIPPRRTAGKHREELPGTRERGIRRADGGAGQRRLDLQQGQTRRSQRIPGLERPPLPVRHVVPDERPLAQFQPDHAHVAFHGQPASGRRLILIQASAVREGPSGSTQVPAGVQDGSQIVPGIRLPEAIARTLPQGQRLDGMPQCRPHVPDQALMHGEVMPDPRQQGIPAVAGGRAGYAAQDGARPMAHLAPLPRRIASHARSISKRSACSPGAKRGCHRSSQAMARA